MKKVLTKLLPFVVLLTSNSFAGLISYLDMKLENDSIYQVHNLQLTAAKHGKMQSLWATQVLPHSSADIASFSMNYLGQLSQDLNFELYDQYATKAGSCSIHIGVGSYIAKPDFTGSVCQLTNGDYLQLNPRYTVSGNTYKTHYKLTNEKSFSRIILFGDSMSDTGNLYKRSVELSLIFPISPILPISPPYYKGRFSDGKVWVELLSKKLNIPDRSLLNYAYGGASVKKDLLPIPNLDKQVRKYLNWNRTGDPYALYVVWIGSNDILRHKDQGEQVVTDSIANGIEYNLRKLISHGAKHILSPKLPDFSMTPDSIEKDQKNGNDSYSSNMKKLSLAYNIKHDKMLRRLQLEFPEVEFITFDIHKFLNDAHDNAAQYGFKYLHERCNRNNYWDSALEICATPKQYVFWDSLHPSGQAHAILAELMYAVVTAKGYKPNVKTFAADLTDDFTERNQEAITELQKDVIPETRAGGYSSMANGLRMVIDEDIPLF